MVYKAAVIGCGMIGSMFADDPKIHDIYSHAGAYSACPDTDLIAVCDTDPAKLEKCSKRWGVPSRHTDLKDMIASVQPDIVSVCTPDETHVSIINTILKNSNVKAIFSEKPLALRVEEAEKIVRLAEDCSVTLAINYSRRYAQNHQAIRECLTSGKIGDVQTVNGYYTKGIFHNGTHWLDLARFFLGEITDVRGFDFLNDSAIDPTLDAVFEFSCGTTGHLHGCDAGSYSIFEMDIIGTRGRVKILDFGHRVEYFKAGDNPYYTGYQSLIPETVIQGGMDNTILHAVEDLVSCLDGKKVRPLCSGRDAVEALKIAYAIKDSATTRQNVGISVRG